MGFTKRSDFQNSFNDLSESFKALGHPARIQIMNILLQKKSCTCGEIVSDLPLAQSTVSKHLLELKKASFVNIQFAGKSTIYSIEENNFQVLIEFLSSYTIFQKKKENHNLTTFLENNENLKSLKTNRKPNFELKKYNYQFKHLNAPIAEDLEDKITDQQQKPPLI